MARRLAVALAIIAASTHAQERRPVPPQDVYAKPRETVHMRLAWAECIDNELRARKLNDYGDPQGTKYTGGDSPDLSGIVAAYREIEKRPDVGTLDDDMRLFLVRYAWILHRHPEMATTCFPADAQDTTTELTDDEINNFLRAERQQDEKHALAVLRVRLVGPSSVKRGEPVKLAYEIVSTSDAPAMIGTGEFPAFIIERHGADGRWAEVWSWGNGLRRMPLIVRPVTASTPYHYEVTWNQTDGTGVAVPLGEYRLSTPSSTQPNLPAPAAVTFRIVD